MLVKSVAKGEGSATGRRAQDYMGVGTGPICVVSANMQIGVEAVLKEKKKKLPDPFGPPSIVCMWHSSNDLDHCKGFS